VLQTNHITKGLPLKGESIAAAAASCTHLFVASVDAFTTYDAATLKQVARVTWSGGGRTSPAIGPTGFVYGVTHAFDQTGLQRDSLVVFAAPHRRPGTTRSTRAPTWPSTRSDHGRGRA
jgi:hypothetical protein